MTYDEALLAGLKAENDRLREKLRNLIQALPDTRRLLVAREDALAELEGNSPK